MSDETNTLGDGTEDFPMGEVVSASQEDIWRWQVRAVRELVEDLNEYPNKPTFQEDVARRISGALEMGKAEAEGRARERRAS